MRTTLSIAFGFCLVVIALVSCRKEEARILSGDLSELNFPSSCANGQLDDGELFIDCGGACPPCNSPNVPCDNEANVLVVNGQTLNMNVSCSNEGSERVVTGAAPNYSLIMTFSTPVPNVLLGNPGTRSIVNSSVVNATQVKVALIFSGNQLNANSGTVYVDYNEDGFVLDVCDVTASAIIGFSEIQRTFSAQLNCNF